MFKSIKLILFTLWALALVTPVAAQIGGVGWSLKPLQFHSPVADERRRQALVISSEQSLADVVTSGL